MPGEDFSLDLIILIIRCGLISIILLAVHFICTLARLLLRKRSPPVTSSARARRGRRGQPSHRGSVDARAALLRAASAPPKSTRTARQ